jgi:sec-independent protein translocase protein TatB
MLLDFGWSELMLIGVVALVVIGPKDLPRALRVAGYWVRKARTLSREFQNSVEQMIRDAELDEVRQDLKKATELDFHEEFRNTIDPSGELAEALRPPELPSLSRPEPESVSSAPTPSSPEPAAIAPPPAEHATPGPTPGEHISGEHASVEHAPVEHAPVEHVPGHHGETGAAPAAPRSGGIEPPHP